jgi:hypothetical protein
MNNATNPIRRVSVLSTGQVQIHPDHEAATCRRRPRPGAVPVGARPVRGTAASSCCPLVLKSAGMDSSPSMVLIRIAQASGFHCAASQFRSVSSLIRAPCSRAKIASVLFRTSV